MSMDSCQASQRIREIAPVICFYGGLKKRSYVVSFFLAGYFPGLLITLIHGKSIADCIGHRHWVFSHHVLCKSGDGDLTLFDITTKKTEDPFTMEEIFLS